jgi:hypothetical protein
MREAGLTFLILAVLIAMIVAIKAAADRTANEEAVQVVFNARHTAAVEAAIKRRVDLEAAKAAKLAAELPVEVVKPPPVIGIGDKVRIWGDKLHGRVLQVTAPLFLVRVDGSLAEVRFFRDELEPEAR